MAIIDLSMTIEEGMLTYPVAWHPSVEITQLGRHGVEGRETRKITLGSHCGTHIDAPAHFIPGGETVESIDLERINGRAVLLDFSEVTDRRIDKIAVMARLLGMPARRVIIRTGWDARNKTKGYYDGFPHFTEDAAKYLIEEGCTMLGMDTPSPDALEDRGMPVHKALLGAGVILVEYLTGLSALPTGKLFSVIVAPLKIRGGDGSPARVYAVV